MTRYQDATPYATVLGTEIVTCFQPDSLEDGSITPNDILALPVASGTFAGTLYAFSPGDERRIVEFTSNSSITLVLPSDARFPTIAVGSIMQDTQLGAGRISHVADLGVTVRYPKDASNVDCKIMRTINGSAVWRKRASNDWICMGGDLSAT